jgi:hypothetical protein
MTGYWNEINMKETKEIIQNDCMMTRQRDALDEAGGRFSKITPATVTGQQSPSAQIPRQPEGSPWASNPVPPGEVIDQLGYDINEVDPVLPAPSASAVVGSYDAGPEEPNKGGIAIGSSTNAAAALSAHPPDDAAAAKGGNAAPSGVPSQPSRSHFRRRF